MALPQNKADKLEEKVAVDIKKMAVDTYRDLRRHEVSKEQARDIVWKGVSTGRRQAEDEISKDES